MKKLLIFLIVIFTVVNCSENEIYIKEDFEFKNLFNEIEIISEEDLKGSPIYDLDLINCNNRFEVIGIITGETTLKIFKSLVDNKSDVNSLKASFISLLDSSLSKYSNGNEYSYSDYSSNENKIIDVLIDIYIVEGFESFIIKSKKIEDLLINTKTLKDTQKYRILTFTSVIRQNIGIIKRLISDSKSVDPGWEECFKSKLRELQNCGNCFFEKIICAFSWPTCLGVKALDCLVDQIS